MTPTRTDTVDIFNPDMQTPYAQSWTGGIRRKVTKDIGVEVRYVGTRHLQGWGTYNSTRSTSPTTASSASSARRRRTCRRTSRPAAATAASPTPALPGTAPLPIYLAYFNGHADVAGGQSARLHRREL